MYFLQLHTAAHIAPSTIVVNVEKFCQFLYSKNSSCVPQTTYAKEIHKQLALNFPVVWNLTQELPNLFTSSVKSSLKKIDFALNKNKKNMD